MATRIRLTPEVLVAEAQNLLNSKNENDNAISELDSIVNGLLETWRGEAQDAFAGSYNRKRAEFSKFSLEIEKFAKFVKEFANEMEATDKAYAGTAAGL